VGWPPDSTPKRAPMRRSGSCCCSPLRRPTPWPSCAACQDGRRTTARSHEELLVVQTAVEIGDERAVTVVDLRRVVLARAEHGFALLTPARMRDCGIDVGPEAVLLRLTALPEARRPRFREC